MGPGNAHSNGVARDDHQRVFIAATSEVSRAAWLRRAVSRASKSIRAKHPNIELQPWWSAFDPGDVTAQRLIDIATELLGAVVILSADDFIKSRDEESYGPRDNLLLEAGLFLGRLGLPNVLLMREKDSKWPSDLAGINSEEFVRPSARERGNEEIASDDIALGIETFIDRLTRPRGAAAARAIQHSSRRLMRQAEELKESLESSPNDEPMLVPNPTSAYLDAVNEVEVNFATTTYLESEFWTSREISILAANEQMLKRVKAADGKARRLILLRRPLSEELEAQRQRRRSRRSVEPQRLAEMNREFWGLAKSNRDLMKQGFEVKVVYDRNGAFGHLPEQIDFEEGDTELALYDDTRLDVFAGFTSKKRTTVHTYFDGYFEQFPFLRQQVGQYFDQLWNSDDAHDFATFASSMTELINEVDREIDYTSNWLARYDKVLGEDGELKTSESKFVLKKLQERYGSGGDLAAGHIDLGTCTGRYMTELADFVSAEGRIVGVDIDPDCIDVLNLKKQTGELISRADVSRADIRKRDQLPAEKFPIVTCMMGTLCHLQRSAKSNGRWDDEWQVGLENLTYLLADGGDAFVAVWDERACGEVGGKRGLLTIYEHQATSVLCAQTPKPSELNERVAQAGLEVMGAENVKGRLRVLHLHPLKESSAS